MALPDNIISHWYHLFDDFQDSPVEIYAAIEAAIERRQVPDRETFRMEFQEGSLLTANRRYLRIIRNKHSFDICAAPFGTGFFFSWWLTVLPSQWLMYFFGLVFVCLVTTVMCFKSGVFFGFFLSLFVVPGVLALIGAIVRDQGGSAEDAILAMPIVGYLYARVFDPPTYYKIDTIIMFQESVHRAVLEVVDQISATKGIRALSESERKPILKSFTG